MDIDELFAGLQRSDRWSASRLMTLIENEGHESEQVLKRLYSMDGRSFVIGITGWPGVGKSTLINRITGFFLDEGRKVGIIAVDPTSPFSGGGLLGDRLRFRSIDGNEHLFIRSAASRGYQGGLSRSSRAFVKVMEVMGMEIVLLETVGIGQEQVGVSLVADTTVVVLAPGLGDYLQAIKSGIIEIGDIFVINKADRPDADKTVQDLNAVIHMREKENWRPPVVKTVATDGSGIDDVMKELERHRAYSVASANVPSTKVKAAGSEIKEAIKNLLLKDYLEEREPRSKIIEKYASAVCKRQIDPYMVADMMLKNMAVTDWAEYLYSM